MTIDQSDKILFFIYTEAKDRSCLEPLAMALRAHGWSITEIAPIEDVCADCYEGLNAFGAASWPTMVAANVYALHLARLIRTGPFRSIGFEHGVAPFKTYTYAAHFCSFDAYMAPSVFWVDRLRRLYPDQANRFRLGGYPRLDDLRVRLDAKRPARSQLRRDVYRMEPHEALKLVAFSWGVDPAALARLPDRHDVIYLFHPAEDESVFNGRWQQAHAFRSNPSLTSELLCVTDLVVGDVSSLTLEAAALGLPVVMAIDHALYGPDYDVAGGFFTPGSVDYLRVPHSEVRLSSKGVVSLDELITLLECDGLAVDTMAGAVARDRVPGATTPIRLLEVPASLLPPVDDNLAIARAAIEMFLAEKTDVAGADTGASSADRDFLSDLGFVAFCYRNILMRAPDPDGIATYTGLLARSDRTGVGRRLALFQIMHSLGSSDEARARVDAPGHAGPLARVLSAT